MNHPALILRADGDALIGMGHLMRCLALAQAWRDAGGRAWLVTRSSARQRFSAEGLETCPIPDGADDAAFTAETARRQQARWIFVDGYQFDAAWCRAARRTGARLMAVEDFSRGLTGTVDAILNPNPYAAASSDPSFLGGSRYTLLRREFTRYADWERELPEKATRVLVTLGGGDAANLTAGVLTKVAGFDTVAVIGEANPNYHSLKQSAPDVRFERGTDDMARWMAWADIAISAAGTTTWELAYMRLPSLLIVAADNQVAVADEAYRRGTARPWAEGESLPVLAASLATRRELAAKGRELIDGRGAQRVCAFLKGERES